MIRRASFGVAPDGREVEAVTLALPDGAAARILSFGATLQNLLTPDREGRLDDVVLGHDDVGIEAGGIEGKVAGAQGDLALDGVDRLRPQPACCHLAGLHRGLVFPEGDRQRGGVVAVDQQNAA